MESSDQTFHETPRAAESRPGHDDGSPRRQPSPQLGERPPPFSALALEEMGLSSEDQAELSHALQDAVGGAERDEGNHDIQEPWNVEALHNSTKRWLEEQWNRNPEGFARATAVLADASREPKRRTAFGRCGVLEFYLGVLATPAVEDRLLLHALRLIGNCCADTDENRIRTVENNNFVPIFDLLSNPALIHVAVPVIYNVCVDYEPAQAQVAANGVVYALLRLLPSGEIKESALVANACELVEVTREQVVAVDKSPEDSIQLVLGLVDRPDIGTADFIVLANFLLSHLQLDHFQHLCAANKLVGEVLSVLQRSYQFDRALFTADEEASLVQLRLGINQVLSDMSALPVFSRNYPLTSPLITTLLSWLRESQDDQLQTCACVMLGNVAREDGICELMVRDLQVHLPLVSILNGDTKGGVLHAAVGFLKNLAVAGNNKKFLGEAGVIKAVSRLWSLESIPQIQFMSVSLTRQVVSSSVSNIGHLLETLSPDSDPSMRSQTYLSLLLTLFTKADSPPIRMEIGRTIAAICRSLLRLDDDGSVSNETKPLLTRLFNSNEGVSHPIGAMITQAEWPVVRSEGWFALALMASSLAGSHAAVDCIENMDLSQPLSDVIRAPISEQSTDTSSQEAINQSKATRDRDNAMILAHGLLKHNPSNLTQTRRDMLQDLIRGASQRIATQR